MSTLADGMKRLAMEKQVAALVDQWGEHAVVSAAAVHAYKKREAEHRKHRAERARAIAESDPITLNTGAVIDTGAPGELP